MVIEPELLMRITHDHIEVYCVLRNFPFGSPHMVQPGSDNYIVVTANPGCSYSNGSGEVKWLD
jgi:hypothetical protein